MAKKVTRKKSRTSLQKELAQLKKDKAIAIKTFKELASRKKAIEEIKKIKRDVNKLMGAGTKRRVAKELTKDFGRVGFKGIKIIGKFVKERLEAEARAQDRERAMQAKKRKKKR